MSQIHPSAVVSPDVQLGANVVVGPLAVIEDDVVIGDDCQIASHVVIKSGTTLGVGNQIAEGAVVGGAPQHLDPGEKLRPLTIGNHNVIREHATIHRGWADEQGTRIGDHNLLMVNAHVAHDCCVGNHCVLVNNVMVAGHVAIGDRAYLAGACGIHQFCRIGRLAMVGGQSHVSQDVPPFVMLDGKSNRVVGLNLIGLRRSGMPPEQIQELKAAYRVVYRSGLTWKDTLEVLANTFREGPAAELQAFLSSGERGFVQERKVPRGATVPLPQRAAA